MARYSNGIGNGQSGNARIHNEGPVRQGYWRCPECTRDNANYTGSCACGYDKYKGE